MVFGNSVPYDTRVSYEKRVCHVYIALLLKVQVTDISFDAPSIDCQPFLQGLEDVCLTLLFWLRFL